MDAVLDPVPSTRSRIIGGLANGTLVPDLAPRLASALVVVVFSGFMILAFAGIAVRAQGPQQIFQAALYSIPIITLQLGYFSRAQARITPPVSYAALIVQACFVYLPLLQFGVWWLSFPGILAASVLFALPARAGLPLFGLIVVSSAALELVYGDPAAPDAFAIIYATVSTTTTGLIIYGLTRLARLAADLHTARAEFARLAAAEERLRFSRDVHDLLGLSLSAITLKTELSYRLMPDNPERARAELAEVLAMSRKALADVRMVVSGLSELSLSEECDNAQGLLSATGMDVRMMLAGRPPGGRVGTALATVLREGATNVLRHSRATWCEISVRCEDGSVRLDISNDGVEPPQSSTVTDAGGGGGNGIGNLSHRIEALGGRLRAERPGDGTFRLWAVVPEDREQDRADAGVTASRPPSRL